MPRQNRVTPFGEIVAIPERGGWMGNRGRLHRPDGTVTKHSALKAWICCKLSFKSRQRQIMAPNSYTELFFLDEVTAFAAGHRPCGECRRQDYLLFKQLWLETNLDGKDQSVKAIDACLHGERIGKDRRKRLWQATFGQLCDGVMFLQQDSPSTAFLNWQGATWAWSAQGYQQVITPHPDAAVAVLTPESVVRVLRAGYSPQCLLSGR